LRTEGGNEDVKEAGREERSGGVCVGVCGGAGLGGLELKKKGSRRTEGREGCVFTWTGLVVIAREKRVGCG